jgi:hypothetical protein
VLVILKSFKDDAGDRRIAGVDIHRFVSDGRVIEHLGQLQPVPGPNIVAGTYGMFDLLNN